jgi:uncharacterized protein (TIGR00304 family)
MRPDKVFIGFALIFMGISLLLMSSGVQYGGVLIIGPFPIVLASSPDMAVLGILMSAFMLLMLYAFLRW